ncbi:GHMP family kinase ATP-binding protein [Sphaerisporangium perillae]|uniref:GHMP family kinase ATP-binding protein n=1 Tax=Sphaerisporangium perillae TaxID=2935860 RepID=UPI00200EA0BF|nr:hypothetical protein [Sphaerisporangium perillae]
MIGTGVAYGTFGELLQGQLAEGGLDFLVTLPIPRSSRATFRLDPDATQVTVAPGHKSKSLRVAQALLEGHGVRAGGVLTVESDLPEGKGFSSSSADLVATARAVGEAIGAVPGPADIEALLRPIEPTDGVMYDGAVAFLHREVRLLARLGHLPPLTIVSVDEGGSVDTIAFNRRPKPFSDADRKEYARLLDLLVVAVAAGDVGDIGYVATRSALLNQRLNPKSTMRDMRQICDDVGGLGVAVAHSGTAIGLLLDVTDPCYRDRLGRAERACARLAGHAHVDHSLTADSEEVRCFTRT